MESLLQVVAGKDLINSLKAYAALQGLLLRDVLQEAVGTFLEERRAMVVKEGRPDYLAATRGGRVLNVRLPEKVARAVRKAAKEDEVSPPRVLYTAIVKYARVRKLGGLTLKYGVPKP